MSTRQEVQAVIINNDKVLLAQKNKHWRLPKGGLLEGETHLQALKRELHEEVGLTTISSVEQLFEYTFNTPGVVHEVIVYIVRTSQEAMTVDNFEITKAEWIEVHKAKDMLPLKDEKECIERYLARRQKHHE
jgi:ADP-ribose pyrophosphatase YjhB (NUDIX family)